MKPKASLTKRIAQVAAGLLLVALIFAGPSRSFGQAFSANVTGIVSDPGQAVIAGASVTIRNVDTNDTRRASTGSLGRYTFSQLVPGRYELTAEARGFRKLVVSAVQLGANQSAEFDLRLQLGDVATSIEVSAAVIDVDTQTANQSRTLNQQAVLDLPVSTRSPFEFVNTMAGVTSVTRTLSAAPTRDQNYSRFAFNGGRDMTGLVLVDGAPATSGDWGGLLASPGVDSVQEFQLTRNSYDTQFGKSGGGILNLVSKGGSNDLHFSAFEFLRNGGLDANAWDRNRTGNPRLDYQRHQFGGNIGGPISKRNRLFYFGGWENLREEQPQTVTTTVPSLRERQGDFSESRNPNNSLQLVYDPFSGRAGAGGIVRDPFPGNQVPSGRFDKVGKNVVALFPEPNTPGLAITNANNFFGSGMATANNNRFDVRVDWARTEKHTLFVRLSKSWQDRKAPRFYGQGVDTGNEGGNPRHHITIGSTFLPTPTFVVNVLIGSGRWREQQYSPCIQDRFDLSSLGLPPALVSQFDTPMVPGFNASGYAGLGNNRYLDMPRETHNLQVNATRQIGSHTLKFGATGEMQPLYDTDARSASFSFDRGMTSGPTAQQTSTVSGNSIASLFLGTGSGGSAPIAIKPATMQKYYGAYLQDTWRFGRLTLNAGLRYETQRPRTERYNRLSWFDFNVQNPLAQAVGLPLTGGLVFASPSQRGQTDPDNVDLAPRVGLALQLHQRIVVRAGYGIFYLQKLTSGPMSGTDGFSTSTAWVSSVGGGGLSPQDLLSNPFPSGIVQPAGSSQGLKTLAGSGITAWQRLDPSGYLHNYSFDIQFSLARNTLLELGYSGNTGRKLIFGQGMDVDQLDPQYLARGAALNTQVANPFYGQIASGILAGATVPVNRLLRRYPQFASVSLPADTPGAWSSFNALFINFSRQVGSSLNLSTTYQWSKALDNASESGSFRNIFDLASDKSVSAHDVPHSFKTAVVYALPIGRGQRFGATMPVGARAILGGWQVSAIGTLSSGLPLQLTTANSLSTYGFPVLRPNVADLRNLQVADRRPELWFNTAAPSAPAAYTIGNAPRFLPNLRTGQGQNIDMALLKTFLVREHYRIQFRVESFNLTNTPRFDSPGISLGSGTFGVVSAVTNLPRNIQFGIKLLY